MGVRKAVLCSHGPSSIVWSENEPRWGTISYFVGGKKRGGFGLIYYISNSIILREAFGGVSLSWNLLWNLSCWKKYYKIMVSRNLPRKVNENSGRPWNLIHSMPCKTPCRLSIHEIFFGPWGLHLRVWSELGRSTPFRPMRALRLQWSRAFSSVCDGALSVMWVLSSSDQSQSIRRTICGGI